MDFKKENLSRLLAGKRIGNSIHFFREVDSTNDVLVKLALAGAPEGAVVVADCQTKGKGRLDRRWQSPPGCNIYCSIALRPAIAPLYAPQITLMTGVVVADLVSRYCPGVTLKWPNDVEIGGKKICGILTEMSAHRQDKVDFIVVGIGVNVNIRRNDLDGTIRDTATSLADETGQNVSRLDLAVRLFDRFDALYAQLMHAGFGPVKDAWLSCCGMMGKQVKVVFNNSVESGKVTGIDDYGALLISDEKGGIKRIMAGDASVLKT